MVSDDISWLFEKLYADIDSPKLILSKDASSNNESAFWVSYNTASV